MRSPCVWEARRREVSRFSGPSRDGHPLTHTHEQTTKGGGMEGFTDPISHG